MKKILFPTDFSPIAKNAFLYATELAKDIGAQLDIMHVYSINFADGQYYAPHYVKEVMIEKENRKKQELQDFCGIAPTKVIGEVVPILGIFIDQEITDFSLKGNYDLIVMGVKGEGNRIERIIGSTATRIMSEAACPVLVIPETTTYKSVQHITYATTFSPTDLPAMDQLIAFASKLDAQIQLLHISHDDVSETTDYIKTNKYPHQDIAYTVLGAASTEEGIEKYLKENQVDILVLYLPKRSTWERLFHTSFTKKMIFHTDTPLLIFHQ